MQEDYDEKIANLTASYNSMAAKYYKDMGDSIKQLEQSVTNKVEALEQERTKQIQEQNLQLDETIAQIKSSLDEEK